MWVFERHKVIVGISSSGTGKKFLIIPKRTAKEASGTSNYLLEGVGGIRTHERRDAGLTKERGESKTKSNVSQSKREEMILGRRGKMKGDSGV